MAISTEIDPHRCRESPYEVYYQPPAPSTAPSTYWLRTSSPSGTTLTTRFGQYVGVEQLDSAAPFGVVTKQLSGDGDVWYADGSGRLLRGPAAKYANAQRVGVGPASFVVSFSGTARVSHRDSGATRSYAVPAAVQADHGRGTYRGLMPSPQYAAVTVAAGDLPLGFITNGSDLYAYNLGSGTSADVGAFTFVNCVYTASDRLVYALARSDSPGSHEMILVVDPGDFSKVKTFDTGLATDVDDSMLGAAFHEAPDGRIVAVISHGGPTIGVRESAFFIGSDGLSQRALPNNAGLYSAISHSAGDLYLFGGPAQNRVSRLSFDGTLEDSDVPTLAAPAGSYLTALSVP